MPASSHRNTALAALFAIGLTAAHMPSSHAGFSTDEFEEDRSSHDEELNWPEVTFPDVAVRSKGFRPGERFEYRAQWGIFRKAGKMVITTETNVVDEEPKLLVTTETASAGLIRTFYPMTLHATTTIDPEHVRMERNEIDGQTRSEVNKTLTLFDYEKGLMKYEDEIEPVHNKVRPLPYDVPLDYTSALLQLRGLELKVGSVYPIFVSTKGKFYFVEMEVAAKETISTEIGKRQCFRLEPVSAYPQSKLFREGGSMSIWISADKERIPVRFDVKTSVGTATMRIVSYDEKGALGSVARK